MVLTIAFGIGFSPVSSAQVAEEANLQSAVDDELSSPEDWNKRLEELVATAQVAPFGTAGQYRIGPEDLLQITVFEAPEMNRDVRVSASGEISLPLLGLVRAAGLTAQELERVLQELLRRTYMKDPHVAVFVRDMQSHSISVFGAVERPGVLQLRGTRSLLEVLSMAEGLAEDAGDTVIVMRGASPDTLPHPQSMAPATGGSSQQYLTPDDPEMSAENTVRIALKDLLETGDPRHNVTIYPGDIVKVTRAGIVYVVGEVNKQGGFVLESNENVSALRALALAEGLTSTAAKSRAVIIRTTDDGERTETPIDLGKILAGKQPDIELQPSDILFVPNSTAKTAFYGGVDVILRTVSGLIIFGGR
jgi:polysaccharide export outer membrane protein